MPKLSFLEVVVLRSMRRGCGRPSETFYGLSELFGKGLSELETCVHVDAFGNKVGPEELDAKVSLFDCHSTLFT
jgi:hypothetical protein